MSENEQVQGHKAGFVAVIGRPNAGKSTLINSLMKQKVAIVSPKPQTTRVRQLAIITEPEYQMIIIDTPGLIRKPRHKLDKFMIQSIDDALVDADIVLWLVDAAQPPNSEDAAIGKKLQGLNAAERVILAMNKNDLLKPEQLMPRSEAYQALLPGVEWMLFSALNGHGRDALFKMLVERLPEGPEYYPPDQITDLFVRDIAAEMVREQLLNRLNQEVPHGTAVLIESFKERENGMTYIQATIYVERDSHKRIVIGEKGKTLRQIGSAARKEIETLVDGKVFLELWVKVEAKWRRNENSLKRFGYSSG